MNYNHLNQEERYQIYALLREGFSKRHIAFRLQRAPSTIIREIQRNKSRNSYFAKHAHKLANKCLSPNPKTISQDQWQEMKKLLSLQWSPEQISSHIAVRLHSIYRYIHRDKRIGGSLYKNLRFRNQRKRKYGHSETRGQLTNRRNIKERSLVVEERSRFGDLEIDTIVDHKTGYLWLKKCCNRKSDEILKTTIELLSPMKIDLKTITADNGKEFSLHAQIAKELGIDFYFADPYIAKYIEI